MNAATFNYIQELLVELKDILESHVLNEDRYLDIVQQIPQGFLNLH